MVQVGIIGGTGALGKGLAARLALGGARVVLGSRDAERGAGVAADLCAELGGQVSIDGGSNADAAVSPIVILAVPYDGIEANVAAIADHVGEAIVVSTVNPLAFDRRGPYPVGVEEGSVAEWLATQLPAARVVVAFNTVASTVLADREQPVAEDVPVLGDDEAAVAEVIDLVDTVEGARGVAAGALRLARVIEGLTPVLISVNKRYRTHAGIAFSRLDTSGT